MMSRKNVSRFEKDVPITLIKEDDTNTVVNLLKQLRLLHLIFLLKCERSMTYTERSALVRSENRKA